MITATSVPQRRRIRDWSEPRPRTYKDRLVVYTTMLIDGDRPAWYIAELLHFPVKHVLAVLNWMERQHLARVRPPRDGFFQTADGWWWRRIDIDG